MVERRVLTDLYEEIESAKVRFEYRVAALEGVIASSSDLLNSLGKDVVAISPSTAQDLVNRILNLNALEVPTCVVGSIVSSGQVRLI